ncbi:MFS transporter [Cryobacterium sp. PAMC25264]|uniref:MFS transporter n=1 Tax=Cryobacterium sp. PAMC25264 TaxID=2861288 RepID=UPI001C62C1AA|nr:MFS transporter [Cryobacterium sp. PAMC25264]QYF73632.1 MFS transporter [Cryobacterium sp. PAMC25264]
MTSATLLRTPGAPHASTLLVSQLIFNLGFYAVIPFLASTMRTDFLLSGTAIGLVLGARTFFQQGLFLAGGILTDRFGARALIALGCAVRVAGYLLLASADGFAGFLAGAVLTGLGGALFSPALETLVAAADARTRPTRPAGRPSLFAALIVVGELGAAVGPVAGALLLGLSFSAAVLAGAAVFTVVGIVLWRLIPAEQPHTEQGSAADRAAPEPADPWASIRNRRFVVFAALSSINLLAYNQLYLGLSFEVERTDGGTGTLGALFLLVSLLTVALQWPVAALARRVGAARALAAGFTVMAVGFLAVGAAGSMPLTGSVLDTLPAAALVTCLALGHMLVLPVALDLVPLFAGGARLGSFYGLLATCGGVAVLLGSVLLGSLFDSSPAVGWGLLAGLALVSGLTLPRFLPIHPHHS